MYIIIYRFEVVQGHEAQFKEVWAQLTQAYIDHSMSLGSRLHQDENGTFIAYAQWPDEETFGKAKNRLPEDAMKLGPQMKTLCASISILHKLNVQMDLLKRE